LGLLAERDIPVPLGERLHGRRKIAARRPAADHLRGRPLPDAAQCRAIERWLEAGGHWLGLHGTSGGRAERVQGTRQRRTNKTEQHALLWTGQLTAQLSGPLFRS
jgi:hypothetical protein